MLKGVDGQPTHMFSAVEDGAGLTHTIAVELRLRHRGQGGEQVEQEGGQQQGGDPSWYASRLVGSSSDARWSLSCLVTDFGAECDGKTDDTLAVQKALDKCGNYSGIVSLPAGKTCLSFPLAFHNGTQLQVPVGATLKAFPSVTRWPNKTMFNFVELRHHRDIAVYGGGTIDGSGEQWWVVELPELNDERPRLFHMSNIHNVSFRGITLMHTAGATLGFNTPCSSVVVDGVTIINPAFGNTDGIDVGCDGARIKNSHVTNGDDSICMKSGAKNVLVESCTVTNGKPWPGQVKGGLAGGLVLGTSDNDSMENVTYRNCTVTGALAGIRFKFRPSQTGFVRNVRFDNIMIHRPVAYAVDMLMTADHLQDQIGTTWSNLATVNLTDVSLSNIHGELGLIPQAICGEGRTCPRAVGRFSCTAEFPCKGISIENFDVSGFHATAKYPTPCSWVYVSGHGSGVQPSGCMPPGSEELHWPVPQ
jgi:polygalacturonase